VSRQLTWTVEFYLLSDRSAPAIDFLGRCPVAGRIEAIAEAVRGYPPPSFPPSHMWHVMSGTMKGLYEIRVRHRQTLHRLFCLLDANAVDGLGRRFTTFCGPLSDAHKTFGIYKQFTYNGIATNGGSNWTS